LCYHVYSEIKIIKGKGKRKRKCKRGFV